MKKDHESDNNEIVKMEKENDNIEVYEMQNHKIDNLEESSENNGSQKLSSLEVQQDTEGKLIDKIIENLGINPRILSIYAVISLFLLADGGEMIVLSLLITKLGALWNLSEYQKGFLGSCVFIGFFFGALISGKLSDVKGRKPAFIVGSLLVSIFGVGSALASNYTQLIILRTFFGLGIGLSVPAISSLTTEITKVKWRAWVLNCIWVMFPLGEMLAIIEAKYLLEYENGWRYLLGLVGLPCFFCFLISFFVYESPRFYLSKRDYEKSYLSLNGYLLSSKFPELTEAEKEQLKKENETDLNMNNHKSNFSQLFKSEYIRLTLLICLIFFISSFVYYGLIFIQPQISDEEMNINNSESKSDQESKMYYGLVLASFSEIPSTLLTSYLANLKFLGRIRSMAFGFLLSAFSASLCFLIASNKYIYMTMLKFSIGLPFGIIYIYVCEAYPTKFRTIGIGVSNSFTRLGGISTPFLSQISFAYKKNLPFFNFTLLCFVGIFAALGLPFETLGKNII